MISPDAGKPEGHAATSPIRPGGVKPGEKLSSNYAPTDVLTVTPTGTPVKRRIVSIQVARDLLRRTEVAFEEDSYRRARLKAQADGEPPYEPGKLEELGLGYMTNVNFQEMASILSQKANQFHEVFYEVPTVASFVRAPGTPPDFDGYARIVEQEFHTMLMSWSGFIPLMDKARRDADLYGIGLAIWPDEFDWRPRSFATGSFLFDPGADMDPESIQYFFLCDTLAAGDLIRMALDPSEDIDTGWNRAAVKRLLARVYVDEVQQERDGRKYPVPLWEDLMQRVRNGDHQYDVKEFERVSLRYLFVREVSGSKKLSLYIFTDGLVDDEMDDFLYVRHDIYQNVANALWLLPYDNGDGYLKSVRGLASRIETHCDLSNRYLGRVFDTGFLSNSVLLQPRTGGDYSQASMIRAGIMSILPPNFDVIQRTTMAPSVAQQIPLRNLSLSIMRNNTGVWREHPEVFEERTAQKTARQVAEEASRESRMEKTGIQFDYNHIDRLYKEIWRRAVDPMYLISPIDMPGRRDALEMVQRCIRRGVPEQLFFESEFSRLFIPKVTKSIGMGSWGVKLDISNQILGMSGGFDEVGRHNAKRDRAAILVGYDNVDRYVAPLNRDTVPSENSNRAELENNDLKEGQMVNAFGTQHHSLHVDMHLPLAIEILERVAQKAVRYPRQDLSILTATLGHIESHSGYVMNDPARAETAEKIKKIMQKGLAAQKVLMNLVKQDMAAEAKLQEANQGVVSAAREALNAREHEVELERARGATQVQAMREQSLGEIRRQKTEAHIQTNVRRTEAELELKRARQAAEIEIEREKAAAKREASNQ